MKKIEQQKDFWPFIIENTVAKRRIMGIYSPKSIEGTAVDLMDI
jgi:hypothetical protein